jgi:hypothetical protein
VVHLVEELDSFLLVEVVHLVEELDGFLLDDEVVHLVEEVELFFVELDELFAEDVFGKFLFATVVIGQSSTVPVLKLMSDTCTYLSFSLRVLGEDLHRICHSSSLCICCEGDRWQGWICG